MQKYLGHHSILTTVRYTHLTDQTKHHAIERINGLMNGFQIVWGQHRTIRLATVIESFEADFRAQFSGRLISEHLRALAAMKQCRTQASPKMQVQCSACPQTMLIPHSCG